MRGRFLQRRYFGVAAFLILMFYFIRFSVISASCLTYFKALTSIGVQAAVFGVSFLLLILIFSYMQAFVYRSINFAIYVERQVKFFFWYNAQESFRNLNYRLFVFPDLVVAITIGFLYFLFTITFYYLFAAYIHEQFRVFLRIREEDVHISLASNCRRWLCDWGCSCSCRSKKRNNPYNF